MLGIPVVEPAEAMVQYATWRSPRESSQPAVSRRAWPFRRPVS
jgi:hypothetical protein